MDLFRLVVFRGVAVLFYYFSRSSRTQRGYVRCPCHDACFRYCQVHQFADRTRLVAYLVAWRMLGDSLDRSGHQSRACQPDETLVTELEAEVVLTPD
jgi:hypothetical protein